MHRPKRSLATHPISGDKVNRKTEMKLHLKSKTPFYFIQQCS